MWLKHRKSSEQRTWKDQTNYKGRIEDGNRKAEGHKFEFGEKTETNRQKRYRSKTGRWLNNEPDVINEFKRVAVGRKQDRRNAEQNSFASNLNWKFETGVKFKEQDNWKIERLSVGGWKVQVSGGVVEEWNWDCESEGVFIWEDLEGQQGGN